MPRCIPSIRRWKIVLVRLVLDIAIGMTIGSLFWVFYFVQDGKLLEAIKGNVDDAHSLLQGLITMGAMVGGVIGFFHGMSAVEQFKNRNRDE